ncbi:MAG: hypothetical protein ACM3S4_05595 [Burkholderiales bacterium]
MKLLLILFIVMIMFLAAVFAGCSQNDQAPGTASPTSVPYPDAEDNINNYNNGLALEENC